MRFQAIYDIAALCSRKGIDQAILCPGSRCAPLTIAFTRHPKITCRTFSDERSAGFIALGIAQDNRRATALICTSGTAVYNFAPAVAEAFFSETPLLVLTADRPSEWIAQHDGQTIFQTGIFGKHVKRSFELPQDYTHPDSIWEINRIVNEAINLAESEPKGPVHINAPFREPLYPEKDEKTYYSEDIRTIDEQRTGYTLMTEQVQFAMSELNQHRHILVAVGQTDPDHQLMSVVAQFSKKHQIPVVADVISNFHDVSDTIHHADLFLGQAPDDVKKTLQPDLLITFGRSFVSKNLKLFLRKFSPRSHWHIQPDGPVADPLKNVTHVFRTTPIEFFRSLQQHPPIEPFETQKQHNFYKLWEIEDRRSQRVIGEFLKADSLSELGIVRAFLSRLPSDCDVHFANSMSVRYANFFGIADPKRNIRVFSNRGTSGIDGCTSTAIGTVLSSGKPTFLVTGDLAFFYDRNAFWHNYPTKNFRILLLNNHGGQIFNMIDGPASQPESREYFVTRQPLNAKKLAEEFDFDYLALDSVKKTKNLLNDFFDLDGRTRILEVTTDIDQNRIHFDQLKQKIKNSYDL